MEQVLEIGTLIMGGLAMMAAFAMALYFSRSPRGIGRAVAVDKFAEGVNMCVIFAFSLAYYLDLFKQMPIEWAAALRLTAIVATLTSSAHLAYQTKQILRGEIDNG